MSTFIRKITYGAGYLAQIRASANVLWGEANRCIPSICVNQSCSCTELLAPEFRAPHRSSNRRSKLKAVFGKPSCSAPSGVGPENRRIYSFDATKIIA